MVGMPRGQQSLRGLSEAAGTATQKVRAGPPAVGSAARLQNDRPGVHTARVGLDPYRAARRSPTDYLFVAAAVLACLALVAWAMLG